MGYNKNPNVDISCKVCNKIFIVVYSRKDKAMFCSIKCRIKGVPFNPPNKGKFIAKTYGSFHYKVSKIRGKPSKCEECNSESAKKYEWANLTGRYDDVNDYKRMCTSCHCKFDNKIKNITGVKI